MDRWPGRLFKLSLVGWGLIALGCQAGPSLGTRTAAATPDFPALLASAGTAPPLSRGQKPEPRPNLLNIQATDPGSSEARGARVRAVVNDQAILDEEVYAAAYSMLPGARTEVEKAEILNAKLNEIIDREVVLQDAEAKLGNKAGGKFIRELKRVATQEFEKQWLYKLMAANKYTDVKAFKEFCAQSGMSVDLIQRQWERGFIAMEYLRGRIEPNINRISNREVMTYYDRHPEEFRVEESLEWQDLFIATARFPTREAARQFAESLVARLRQGQSFVELSKQYDHGDSSLRENSVGLGRKRGEIRPVEAEPVLLSLKEGEVGPLVEMESGFHIVKVLKKTEAGREPFDDKVQRKIRDRLRGEVFQREMKRMVNDLKRKAIIQVAEEIK